MVIVALGKGKYYLIEAKTVPGTSSYPTGGFAVNLDELSKVHDAIVVLESADNLYKPGFTVSGNTITIQVYEYYYDTTASAVAVKEVAAGTDLSSVNFKILAIGE